MDGTEAKQLIRDLLCAVFCSPGGIPYKMHLFRRLAKVRSGVEVAVRVRPVNQRETLQAAAETAEIMLTQL